MNVCPICRVETHDGMTRYQPGEGSSLVTWEACPTCVEDEMKNPLVRLLVEMFDSTRTLLDEAKTERDELLTVVSENGHPGGLHGGMGHYGGAKRCPICVVVAKLLAKDRSESKSGTIDAEDLLLAIRHRTELVAFLTVNLVPHNILPLDHPDHPEGVGFQLANEHWLATYWPTGHLKFLAWG